MHVTSRVPLGIAAILLFLAPLAVPAGENQELLKKQIELLERQNKNLELQVKQQQKEIDLLQKAVRDREVSLAKLQADLRAFAAQSTALEVQAKIREIQNEKLLTEIRQLMLKIARLEAGAIKEPPVRDPVVKNPPLVKVNGRIEKVDGGLLQINLGVDHGVQNNHTLDVYRLTPEPKYLGTVRIVNAGVRTSVGRLVGKAADVKDGDLVTSELDAKKAR